MFRFESFADCLVRPNPEHVHLSYSLGSSDTAARSDTDTLPDAVEYFGGVRDPDNPRNFLDPWIVDVAGKAGALETLADFSADMMNNDIISLPAASRTFILREGETLEVRSNGFYDDDGGGVDDQFNDDVKTFPAQAENGSDTRTNLAASSGGGADGNSITGSSIITSFNLRIVI